MKDKKHGLAILLGIGPEKKGMEDVHEDKDDMEDGFEMGLEAASEEILEAIKEEDAGALREALKSFITICKDKYKKEKEEEE